jgi:hypothetical protein
VGAGGVGDGGGGVGVVGAGVLGAGVVGVVPLLTEEDAGSAELDMLQPRSSNARAVTTVHNRTGDLAFISSPLDLLVTINAVASKIGNPD